MGKGKGALVDAPVRGDVGVRAPGAVERGRGERAGVLVDVALHGRVLEGRPREVVREPAAGLELVHRDLGVRVRHLHKRKWKAHTSVRHRARELGRGEGGREGRTGTPDLTCVAPTEVTYGQVFPTCGVKSGWPARSPP